MSKNGITSLSSTVMLILDASTLKLFFNTYLIVKVHVSLPLIPILKSFVFPIALSGAVTWSSGSIFIFWEVR
jgi:hypothetical protein